MISKRLEEERIQEERRRDEGEERWRREEQRRREEEERKKRQKEDSSPPHSGRQHHHRCGLNKSCLKKISWLAIQDWKRGLRIWYRADKVHLSNRATINSSADVDHCPMD